MAPAVAPLPPIAPIGPVGVSSTAHVAGRDRGRDRDRSRDRDRDRGRNGRTNGAPPPVPVQRANGSPPGPSPEVSGPAAIPLHLIDRDALEVVRRLRRYGHTAYLVGGCVRDLSLGLVPKDFDVATSARPEEIRSVFRNCRIVGRRFRLAHVYFRGGKVIETSTFRAAQVQPDAEGAGSEGETAPDLLIRHDNIFGSEEEDARRRDFTINALFYDVGTGRIIDHVGGLGDLKAKRVRMIGNPDIRLREDPVRILRAARIAAKTDLAIDAELLAAMSRHRFELARCAKARVLEETFKLLRSGNSERSVQILDEAGALDVVLPEAHAFIMRHRENGPGANLFYAFLASLDKRVQRGAVGDVVVLGALLAAPLQDVELNAEPSDRGDALSIYLEKISERLGITRRMSERFRQIVAAQKHFAVTEKRGRRKVAPTMLMRRAYFEDALDLFEIITVAMKLPEEDLRFWRERWAKPNGGPALNGRAPRSERRASREADADGIDGAEIEIDEVASEGADAFSESPRERRPRRRRRPSPGQSRVPSPAADS